MEFTYNNNYKATIVVMLLRALYVKRCMSLFFYHDKVGEHKLLRLEFVQVTMKQIKRLE